MITGGLTSVSFRKMSPENIVSMVAESGLKAIEWGGDIHVPHGNIKQAQFVRELMEDAGLTISSYGSYYCAGESEKEGLSFESVLSSALALGVKNIRIWAGKKASCEADGAYRESVVSNVMKIADIASKEDVSISFEFHNNTLTDTNESCKKLLDEINMENVLTYWQPRLEYSEDERKAGLKTLSQKISNFHVFKWEILNGERILFPLAEGIEEWQTYFDFVKNDTNTHYALLEVFGDYTPDKFLTDASNLWTLIRM